MKALFPRTLFGQTLLTLLLGIGLALSAGAWIYASARQEAVRAVGALAAAERIVNLTRLVAEVPQQWRAQIVAGASDQSFRVTLANSKPSLPGDDSESAAATSITDLLREALPGRQISVAVHSAEGVPFPIGRRFREDPPFGQGAGRSPGYGGGFDVGGYHHHMGVPGAGGMRTHGPLARAAMSWRGLEAAVELPEGQWLLFATTLPDTGPAMSPRLLFALLVSAAIIASLTAWAVRRTTAPLRLLSDAADRLGRNVDSAPLPVGGTSEMRRASTAFNEMQARLRRLIENRTLMLAAISHDLRTELILLRLRAENVTPIEDRDRLMATLDEMERMLTATLSFARDEAAGEISKRTNVGAFVMSIVDDLSDAGLDVGATCVADAALADIKPLALRRALTNLIDNAAKYGKRARVSLTVDPPRMVIVVDDDGPGIPEDQIEQVLQPFVRLERSRSRETGGMGLGLAIAASAADAHGGTLRLSNRPEGGLRAVLELPLAAAKMAA